jgi:arylsulfatase A-like enzyme
MTKAGSVSSEPVISTDFFPTISGLADISPEANLFPDGRSLLPVFKGESLQRQALYWHYPHYHGSAWTPGAAVRAGDWKLIEFYDKEKVELYNLRRDPGERTDLASDEPEKKRELLGLLRGWQKEIGAKMPRPNPDRKP